MGTDTFLEELEQLSASLRTDIIRLGERQGDLENSMCAETRRHGDLESSIREEMRKSQRLENRIDTSRSIWMLQAPPLAHGSHDKFVQDATTEKYTWRVVTSRTRVMMAVRTRLETCICLRGKLLQ